MATSRFIDESRFIDDPAHFEDIVNNNALSGRQTSVLLDLAWSKAAHRMGRSIGNDDLHAALDDLQAAFRQTYHGCEGEGECFRIITSWTVADVRSLAPDITLEDALTVLENALHHFDANEGINWTVLQAHIDLLRG